MYRGCKEAIDRLTYEAIEDKWKDGVKYLELRLVPQFLTGEK